MCAGVPCFGFICFLKGLASGCSNRNIVYISLFNINHFQVHHRGSKNKLNQVPLKSFSNITKLISGKKKKKDVFFGALNIIVVIISSHEGVLQKIQIIIIVLPYVFNGVYK